MSQDTCTLMDESLHPCPVCFPTLFECMLLPIHSQHVELLSAEHLPRYILCWLLMHALSQQSQLAHYQAVSKHIGCYLYSTNERGLILILPKKLALVFTLTAILPVLGQNTP